MSVLDLKQLTFETSRFTPEELRPFTKAQLLQLQTVGDANPVRDPSVKAFMAAHGNMKFPNLAETYLISSAINSKGTAIEAGLNDAEAYAIRSGSHLERTLDHCIFTTPDKQTIAHVSSPFPMLREEKRTGVERVVPLVCSYFDLNAGEVEFCANKTLFDEVYGDVKCPLNPDGIPAIKTGLKAVISNDPLGLQYIQTKRTLTGAAFYEFFTRIIVSIPFESYLYFVKILLTTFVRGYAVTGSVSRKNVKVQLLRAKYGEKTETVIPETSLLHLTTKMSLSDAAREAVKKFRLENGHAPTLLVGPLRPAQRWYTGNLSDSDYWNLNSMFSVKRGAGPLVRTINHGVLQSKFFVEANTIAAMCEALLSSESVKFYGKRNDAPVMTTAVKTDVVVTTTTTVKRFEKICVKCVPNIVALLRPRFSEAILQGLLVFCVDEKAYRNMLLEQRSCCVTAAKSTDFVIDLLAPQYPMRSAHVKKSSSDSFFRQHQEATMSAITDCGIYRVQALHASLFQQKDLYIYCHEYQMDRLVYVSSIPLRVPEFRPVVSWDKMKEYVLTGMRAMNIFGVKPNCANRKLGSYVHITGEFALEVNEDGKQTYTFSGDVDDGIDYVSAPDEYEDVHVEDDVDTSDEEEIEYSPKDVKKEELVAKATRKEAVRSSSTKRKRKVKLQDDEPVSVRAEEEDQDSDDDDGENTSSGSSYGVLVQE